MGRLTVHRGPDDEGAHVDGPCAIGMRRLSIIDVAGGHQPLRSADGKIWLVCNGEIYNFRELRSELEGRGHAFLTHSDCEVIIPLYRELGDRLVDRLNGMFGFALWDAERRRLLVGRDRLGIKPLYTWSDGRHFAFASEAKALFALPGVVPALDEDAVAGLSATRLRRGAAHDLPRRAQAGAGDRGHRRGRTRHRAALLADRRDDRPRAHRRRMGGAGSRAHRRVRPRCRW